MDSESFDVQGEWWLPGADTRVPGSLSFSASTGARLSLIGALRGFRSSGDASTVDGTTVIEFSENSITRSGVYQRIHGEADGTGWTLEDGFRTQLNSKLGGGIELETIHVNQVFRGVHFDTDEELAASGVTIELEHLAHWTLESGLDQSMTFNKDGSPVEDATWATLSARALPERAVALPEGLMCKLGQTLGVSGDRVTESALRQDFYLRVDASELMSITALMDWVGDLQDLVSIAVDRPASFKRLRFWHPDLVHEIGSRAIAEPFELFAQWADEPSGREQKAVLPHEMVFTLPDLGDLPGVARWLDAAIPHRTAIRRVMRTRSRRALFTADLLLNRAAALESFDRVRSGAGNSKFKTRMRRCSELAGQPFLEMVEDLDRWLEAMRRERDAIAHHFAGRLAGGAAQHYLAESAYWLFVLCLMRIADLPDEVFTRLGSDQRIMRLRRELPGTY